MAKTFFAVATRCLANAGGTEPGFLDVVVGVVTVAAEIVQELAGDCRCRIPSVLQQNRDLGVLVGATRQLHTELNDQVGGLVEGGVVRSANGSSETSLIRRRFQLAGVPPAADLSSRDGLSARRQGDETE